mgnify:CR=1 FL=1
MKVAILGNIAGVANEIVVELRKNGIEADLFLRHNERQVTVGDLQSPNELKSEWIKYLDYELTEDKGGIFSAILNWVRKETYVIKTVYSLFSYDVIHSHTASLCFSPLSYLLFIKLRLKKYLAFATGSDLREEARFAAGLKGKVYRDFFRRSKQTLLLNADMVKFKEELKLVHAEFFPFMINEEKYKSDTSVEKPVDLKNKLVCFMMSNLDFGINDSGSYRNSMKNNDRFFYALAEFIREDKNIHAFVLDRGADSEIAKELVSDLNLNDYVSFLPPQKECNRIKWLNIADVVIDQFNIGAFGLGALEALSMGKPLITYFGEDYLAHTYDDDIPILNAQTTEQIKQRLFEIRDPGIRQEISIRARQWILIHHARDVVRIRLMEKYQLCSK